MLVENQFVEMCWNYANKNYYINKGYKFTKYKDKFLVKAEDLNINSKINVKIKCDYCNELCINTYQGYIRSKKNINKYSCKKCIGKKCAEITFFKRQKYLYDNLLKQAKLKGYTITTEQKDIKNNRTYIEYNCPKHGKHIMKISNFLSGKGCPNCVHDLHKKICQIDINEVENRIFKFNGSLLNKEEYVNNTTKNLKIICPECGKIFITSLRNFTQYGGQVCDACSKRSESMGEKEIRYFLETKNIIFYQEYWFSDCRDINPLPFDFYIPSKRIIIEFDGRQHFSETNFFSYSYDKVKFHDEIKNKYCIDNNIKLIRIPYWNIGKISEILNKELNLHKDIV